MEYFLLLIIGVMVIWLLSKIRSGSSPPRKPENVTQSRKYTPKHGLGRGLDALLPTEDQPISETHESPPPPPNWTEEELENLYKTLGEEPLVPESEHPDIERWIREEDDELFPPEPDQTEGELWPGVEVAINVFKDAGLFSDFEDKDHLSRVIRDRLESYDRMMDRQHWHDMQSRSLEQRHPWTDIVMLLAFGQEAGFALHNAFDEGLSTEALNSFVEACSKLCGDNLQVEPVAWDAVEEDKAFQLQVGQTAIGFSFDEPLWIVPIQIVDLLNNLLTGGQHKFEVVSLLPVYGETLVFYLDKEQKQILATKRGWMFFDWGELKGAQHA